LIWDRNTFCYQINNNLTENQDKIIELLKRIGKSKSATIADKIGKDRSNTHKRLQALEAKN
ncbi:MAG: hypothetical protein ACTSRA_14075, partial [Promethearchaeota archaeon]